MWGGAKSSKIHGAAGGNARTSTKEPGKESTLLLLLHWLLNSDFLLQGRLRLQKLGLCLLLVALLRLHHLLRVEDGLLLLGRIIGLRRVLLLQGILRLLEPGKLLLPLAIWVLLLLLLHRVLLLLGIVLWVHIWRAPAVSSNSDREHRVCCVC